MPDGEDELEATVSRWAADEEVRELARIRAAAHRLTDRAADERDLTAVLADLVARGRPVGVTVTAGRVHRGVLRSVGADFLALATERAWGLVALGATTAVRVEGGGVAPGGGTPPGQAPGGPWAPGPDWSEFPPHRLADAVERLAGRDLPVRVHTRGDGVGTVGELTAAGPDFLQLTCDPERPARDAPTVYVPLGSVAELWLLFRSG